jgi:hypothetical protein
VQEQTRGRPLAQMGLRIVWYITRHTNLAYKIEHVFSSPPDKQMRPGVADVATWLRKGWIANGCASTCERNRFLSRREIKDRRQGYV